MTIIYRKNETVDLKISDIIFKIKPMLYNEKMKVLGCISNQEGSMIENAGLATFYCMKYCIKGISGLFETSGEAYKLSHDAETGYLSDDSIDEILNLELGDKLSLALQNFIKGVPSKLTNPHTGEELKGIEIVPRAGLPKK